MLTFLPKKILLFFALISGPLGAQQIVNVVASQPNAYTVKIEYTLMGIQSQKLAVYYKAQSGATFIGPLTALSGDTGTVAPGRHTLFWQPLQEPGIDAIYDALIFKVDVKGLAQTKPQTGKPWSCGELLTDVEGNTYKTVLIGKQCWMAENLKTAKYTNGSVIQNITNKDEWENTSNTRMGAWCYYNNRKIQDGLLGDQLGKLYNWYAVANAHGLCPTGWHVPSDDEWTELTNALGGLNSVGEKMKSTFGWHNNGNGNDSSGFKGLPGGNRGYIGWFGNVGSNGSWWSSSEYDTYDAWYRTLYDTNGYAGRVYYDKGDGRSVRCLRD